MELKSEVFTVSKARLLRVALRGHRLLLWGCGGVAAVIFAVLGAMVDLRWLIVLAMLLMIVVPMVMALLFFHYALSPRCFVNVYPHRVTVTESAMLIEGEVPARRCVVKKGTEESEEDDEEWLPARSFELKVLGDEVTRVHCGLKEVSVRLKGTPPGIIIVPYDAVNDGRALANMLCALQKC